MYEEKRVRRGEIYSIGFGDTGESDAPMTRPGLIISSDGCNENSSTVIVAYLTLRDSDIGIHYGPTRATGKPSYVQCESLATVRKNRLGRLMGQLSENEMNDVGSRLDEVLDLGYVDDTPLREKAAECEALRLQLEELRGEMAKLQQVQSQHEDELLIRDVEIAIQKRMYEKAVGIIAAMRAEPDLPERPGGRPGKTHREPAPPKPKSQEEQTKRVDINSAGFTVLRSIGLGNNVVLAVINGRPYTSIEDLKKIPGVNSRLYGLIENRICCVPVEAEAEQPQELVEEQEESTETVKVNVNTATTQELQNAGLSKKTALEIVKHRAENGPFEKLDDLLVLRNFGNTIMKRYGHNLEV